VIYVQTYLPELRPSCVTAELLVHVDQDGKCSVGYSISETASEATISLGTTGTLPLQDAEVVALDVLRQLLRVLPTIVDAPPFD